MRSSVLLLATSVPASFCTSSTKFTEVEFDSESYLQNQPISAEDFASNFHHHRGGYLGRVYSTMLASLMKTLNAPLNVQHSASDFATAWSRIPARTGSQSVSTGGYEWQRSETLGQLRSQFHINLSYASSFSAPFAEILRLSVQLFPLNFQGSPRDRPVAEATLKALDKAIDDALKTDPSDLRNFVGALIGAEAVAWTVHRLYFLFSREFLHINEFRIEAQKVLENVYKAINIYLDAWSHSEGGNAAVYKRLEKYMVPRKTRPMFSQVDVLKFPKIVEPEDVNKVAQKLLRAHNKKTGA